MDLWSEQRKTPDGIKARRFVMQIRGRELSERNHKLSRWWNGHSRWWKLFDRDVIDSSNLFTCRRRGVKTVKLKSNYQARIVEAGPDEHHDSKIVSIIFNFERNEWKRAPQRLRASAGAKFHGTSWIINQVSLSMEAKKKIAKWNHHRPVVNHLETLAFAVSSVN